METAEISESVQGQEGRGGPLSTFLRTVVEQNRHLLGLLHDKNMCEGKALVSVGDHDINMGQQSEVTAEEISFTLRQYQ